MNRSRSRRPAVSSQTTMRTPLGPLLTGALLVAAAFLVYSPAIWFDFIGLDDTLYVSENTYVQMGLGLRNVAWSFSTFRDANWLPLTWLSLMLDSTIYGVRPSGYHLTNVVLHAVNTGLLFAFLVRATGSTARSAFVAAVFALHPLHVESVAWIAERKDVLSLFFGFGSLLAYVGYAKRGGGWRWGATFVLFVCSLLSKLTLVTLPCVFLLLDYWPLGRLDNVFLRKTPLRRLIVEKVPFLAASAAFSVVGVIAQAHGKAVQALAEYPLGTRCLNALVSYLAYLEQAVCPQDLTIFYPYAPDKLSWTAIAVAAVLLTTISVAAVVWIRRCPSLFVGWCWYLGTLVPMIGLLQVGVQQRADRYTYFPLIGLSLAIAWIVPDVIRPGLLRDRVLPCAAVAGLAVLTAITFEQLGYWRDSISLFRHALECTDDNPETRFMLGTALLNAGQINEAIEQFEVSLRMSPKKTNAHYNLAQALGKAGRAEEAAKEYQATLALDEGVADVHNNLGLNLFQRRQYAQARQHLLRAIEIDPSHLPAYVNLANLCLKTGDSQQAIAYCERALSIHPGLLDAHQCLALALRSQGRIDEAIKRFEHLIAVAPADKELQDELARTLALKHAASPGPAGPPSQSAQQADRKQ